MPTTNEYHTACSTKAKRAALAAQVITLGAEHGATVVPDDMPNLYGPHALRLCLMLGPYRLSMRFDGRSHVGAFLGHWYTDYRDKCATYPPAFGGGHNTVNQYHWRKATTCEYTLDAFLSVLGQSLESLVIERLDCADDARAELVAVESQGASKIKEEHHPMKPAITAATIADERPCMNPASIIWPELPRVTAQETRRTRERKQPIEIINRQSVENQ